MISSLFGPIQLASQRLFKHRPADLNKPSSVTPIDTIEKVGGMDRLLYLIGESAMDMLTK